MGLKSKTENAKQKLAGLFFGHVNVFARESAMLELLKEIGQVKESRARGEEREKRKPSPPPFPLGALAPTTTTATKTSL